MVGAREPSGEVLVSPARRGRWSRNRQPYSPPFLTTRLAETVSAD